MRATLTMYQEDRIGADVLATLDGRSFIALRLGDVTIDLPEFDAPCVAAAKQLIAALTEAVAQIKAQPELVAATEGQ